MTTTYVALLRGVNVGGKNKLPMKDLTAIVTDLGYRAVRTYIQSGNVICEAEAKQGERLPVRLSQAIQARFRVQGSGRHAVRRRT